jgi:hypothetical protein
MSQSVPEGGMKPGPRNMMLEAQSTWPRRSVTSSLQATLEATLKKLKNYSLLNTCTSGTHGEWKYSSTLDTTYSMHYNGISF